MHLAGGLAEGGGFFLGEGNAAVGAGVRRTTSVLREK
jgi:hypothetical protein